MGCSKKGGNADIPAVEGGRGKKIVGMLAYFKLVTPGGQAKGGYRKRKKRGVRSTRGGGKKGKKEEGGRGHLRLALSLYEKKGSRGRSSQARGPGEGQGGLRKGEEYPRDVEGFLFPPRGKVMLDLLGRRKPSAQGKRERQKGGGVFPVLCDKKKTYAAFCFPGEEIGKKNW